MNFTPMSNKTEHKTKRFVWVVEVRFSEEMSPTGARKWEPCASARLTRRDAYREMEQYWKPQNLGKHRVVKYIAAS